MRLAPSGEDKGLGSVTPRVRPTAAVGLPALDFGAAYHLRQHPRFDKRPTSRDGSPIPKHCLNFGYRLEMRLGKIV